MRISLTSLRRKRSSREQACITGENLLSVWNSSCILSYVFTYNTALPIPDCKSVATTFSEEVYFLIPNLFCNCSFIFLSKIILSIILIKLVDNCRAEISPRPVSQDVHLGTTFYLYHLNYVAHALQILCFCQQLVCF